MFPNFSLADRSLGAARPVCVPGTKGIAPWEDKQAGECCTGSRHVGGGSYTMLLGLCRAGELKGPWQFPRNLHLGKETKAGNSWVSEGWEDGTV